MAGAPARKEAAAPEDYRFVVSRAEDAEFETDGLREEFIYRDLGVADGTQGHIHAHIIKAKHLEGGHNGLHKHVVDWQFAMVLKGWVSFFYEDYGLFKYEQGDSVLVPHFDSFPAIFRGAAQHHARTARVLARPGTPGDDLAGGLRHGPRRWPGHGHARTEAADPKPDQGVIRILPARPPRSAWSRAAPMLSNG